MHVVQQFHQEVAKIQEYFSLENKKSNFRTTVAEGTDVPLYILVSRTDSAYLAPKKGLPYTFASHFAPTHLLEALRIYRQESQPSEFLDQPYTMDGVNVYLADTDEEAEKLFTSLIRMYVSIFTGAKDPLYPPTDFTEERDASTSFPAPNAEVFFCRKQAKREEANTSVSSPNPCKRAHSCIHYVKYAKPSKTVLLSHTHWAPPGYRAVQE